MIEDVKLQLAKITETESESSTGPTKRVVYVLNGSDTRNAVEVTVKLQAEEAMPAEYREQIGKHIGDVTLLALGRGQRQTEL